MANVVEQGLEKVKETKFIFDDRGGFEVRNAYIFWTNFRGEENKFGNAARNFNMAVSPEVGKILLEKGWRVRERALYNEGYMPEAVAAGDEPNPLLFFINIKVNMNSKNPPIISLYSEFRGKRTKRALEIESIGELDRMDIAECDFSVNPYESPQFPGKITGYLKKLNAIQVPDIEFGGKYDDWLEEEDDCLALGTCSLDDDGVRVYAPKI